MKEVSKELFSIYKELPNSTAAKRFTDDINLFIDQVRMRYNAKKVRQAKDYMTSFCLQCDSGLYSPEIQFDALHLYQDIFFSSSEEAQKKFTPKKYRKVS